MSEGILTSWTTGSVGSPAEFWGGSTVDIMDTSTMKACGYVAAEGPAAVATVPGIIPDVGCEPKPGG
jgi:hypothetical protein